MRVDRSLGDQVVVLVGALHQLGSRQDDSRALVQRLQHSELGRGQLDGLALALDVVSLGIDPHGAMAQHARPGSLLGVVRPSQDRFHARYELAG